LSLDYPAHISNLTARHKTHRQSSPPGPVLSKQVDFSVKRIEPAAPKALWP
jgi:hypothetical protein